MKKILFILSITCLSCSNDENPPVEQPQTSIKDEVIVAGTVDGAGAWFNGELPTIPYNPNYVINDIIWHDNGFNGSAVFGCGTSVDTSVSPYLYGGFHFANGSATGIQPYLTSPTFAGQDVKHNAIFKDGADYYIAGTDGKRATMWKNGFTKLFVSNSTNMNNKTVNDIFKVGNLIYLVGSETTNAGQKACMWDYDQSSWTNLSVNNNGEATCIDVEGTDIYIGGTENNHGIYYKNGVKNFLTNPSNAYSASVTAIEVVGTDIYVVGSIKESNSSNQVACFWKNGTLNKLIDGTEATDIKINNGNIYICGYQDPTSGSDIGKVWKNGTATDYVVSGDHVYLTSLIVK